MKHIFHRYGILFVVVGMISPDIAHAQAQRITLERPGDREFVLDNANLLSDGDKQKIKRIADQLLTDKAVPIIVVTIDSMTKYGGGGLTIESFAQQLFDQWGIGPAKINNAEWNYGILLVVSKLDRKARIELGAGWKRDKDALAQTIMDDLMVPRFKAGEYSTGILSGVEALDKMARDLKLPSKPQPAWLYPVVVVVAIIAIFTAISIYRSGRGGWAWLIWGVIFSLIGMLLYELAKPKSGSGYSGGSFGGGSSGGGGASGSW